MIAVFGVFCVWPLCRYPHFDSIPDSKWLASKLVATIEIPVFGLWENDDSSLCLLLFSIALVVVVFVDKIAIDVAVVDTPNRKYHW